MADDFDPSLIFGEDPDKLRTSGVRKMCTDAKRCGMGLTCEHAQVRNESCELVPLWVPDGADMKACKNWDPRKELCSENDIFRNKKRHKHNQLRRSNPLITTKRHIRNGDDIA